MNFEVVSGTLLLTDPCYGTGGKQYPARCGIWEVDASHHDYKDWGRRCVDLRVWHQAVNPDRLTWEFAEMGGVDSGQWGVFDLWDMEEGGFYDRCCDITLNDPNWGAIRHGVVTHSGFGDGEYPVEVAYVNGQLVGVRVSFTEESRFAAIFEEGESYEE